MAKHRAGDPGDRPLVIARNQHTAVVLAPEAESVKAHPAYLRGLDLTGRKVYVDPPLLTDPRLTVWQTLRSALRECGVTEVVIPL